jgi:hypothetical protein
MEMVRNMKYTLILIMLSASAFAADFTLAIGSPVAASFPGAPTTSDGAPVQARKVNALFAVRTENCADPANALVNATEESVVNGVRQSAAIRLVAGSGPGVYLVPGGRQTQGVWVVRLLASCGSARAGALVPIGPGGFMRESSKFFSRLVTEGEIDALLKSLAGGAK